MVHFKLHNPINIIHEKKKSVGAQYWGLILVEEVNSSLQSNGGGETPVYYFSNINLPDIDLFDMCNYVHVMEEEP